MAGESPYLKNGELPEFNLVDFRMMLNLIGMPEKAPKPMKDPNGARNANKSSFDMQSEDSESDDNL